MNASTSAIHALRPQILDRRARLIAVAGAVSTDYLNSLIAEIDAALERMDRGSFGLCETCRDPIEPERLESNPLVRFCLDHLSARERRAHEQDLELATEIQARLLPPKNVVLDGWSAHYRYEPAGAVGGDYCELIVSPDRRSLFFAAGDVAGKGVAASLLMTHLSAIFRSLLSLDLPLAEVVSRANRLFSESTSAAHYATLVCGRTAPDGVDLCNAGHCRPLLLGRNGVGRVESTGLPLGLFPGAQYAVSRIPLEDGASVVLYSDGITEAQDPEGGEYGERLIRSLAAQGSPEAMAAAVLGDVVRFRGGLPPQDDMTLLIVSRAGQ